MANSNVTPSAPNGQTPGEIFALITDRLTAGSPFVTERGAFQGYEEIAQLGDWHIALNYCSKVLSLKATSRQACQQLPLLPIATRQAPRMYTVTFDRAGFDRWIAPIAPAAAPETVEEPAPVPAPEAEQPQPTACDLVIATRRAAKFAGASQDSDGKITWWKQRGQEKVTPKSTARLSDTVIQSKLARYSLIGQECTTTEIVHRFNLAPEVC